MNDIPGKTMSSLTVAEKRRQKPGGCVGVIFQLFDWNRKLAKKKLFTNKLLPAVRPKVVSKKLGKAKLLLIADENRGGFPNSKKPETDRADSKCPSMAAGRNKGMRAPGVIARLMGLETMPSRDVSEPNSPSLYECQRKISEHNSIDQESYLEKQPRIRVDDHCKLTEFYSYKQDLTLEKKPTKFESLSVRAESRPQKLQKTGFFERRAITRFQAEALPFKRVISRSRRHHPKLVSPVKSPRVLCGRNASRLMEAATKILEPGLQATNRARCALTYSSSSRLPTKDHVSAKEMPVLSMQCRPTEASKQPNYQNPVRSLKGQSSCKSLDNLLNVVGLRSKFEEQEHECGASASIFSSSSQESATSKLRSLASSLEQERNTETQVHVQDKDTANSVIGKNQERAISLAVQAKANVQRKTPISQVRKLQKDQDRCSSSQQGKQHGQSQKVEQKQNNHRQNQISTKDKLPQKPKPCNQQSRRDPSHGASFRAENQNQAGPSAKDYPVSNKNLNDTIRSKTSTKVLVNKETQKDIESTLSRLRTLPQRKRPVSCNSQVEITGTVNSAFLNGKNKRNVVINGKGAGLNPHSINRNGVKSLSRKQGCSKNTEQDSVSSSKEMDIVSFTFTSPMRSDSRSSSSVERRRTSLHGDSCGDTQQKKTTLDPKNGRSPSPGSRKLDGDALSTLLEQKLRELTCPDGHESATRVLPKECPSGRSTASLLQELLSALMAGRPMPQEHDENLAIGFSPEDSCCCNSPSRSECSSTHSQTCATDRKFQAEVFSDKCTPVGNSLRADKVGVCIGFPPLGDSDHPSPVSILEASFSNESCISSQSLDGNSVDKLHHLLTNSSNKLQSLYVDTDLSDSATSANMRKPKNENITNTTIDIPNTQAIDTAGFGLTGSELDYVREVISNAELLFENVALYDLDSMGSSIVDPLLFDKLETLADALWRSPKSGLGFVEAKNGYQFRKFLFDCMIECLDLKYGRYCKAGLKAWAKLPLSVCRKRLSREVYEEIRRWRSFAGKVLDEMVEREMSSPLGKWTDFEIEGFETGVEIEREILQMLVDETVIDLLRCRAGCD